MLGDEQHRHPELRADPLDRADAAAALELDGGGDEVGRLGLGRGHGLLLRRRHRDRGEAGVAKGVLDHEGREYLWLDDESAHHFLFLNSAAAGPRTTRRAASTKLIYVCFIEGKKKSR